MTGDGNVARRDGVHRHLDPGRQSAVRASGVTAVTRAPLVGRRPLRRGPQRRLSGKRVGCQDSGCRDRRQIRGGLPAAARIAHPRQVHQHGAAGHEQQGERDRQRRDLPALPTHGRRAVRVSPIVGSPGSAGTSTVTDTMSA